MFGLNLLKAFAMELVPKVVSMLWEFGKKKFKHKPKNKTDEKILP